MHYHQIHSLLARPTVRILAIDSAPLVLGFFHSTFKATPRLAISEDELKAYLTTYLDELRTTEPGAHPATASDYLNDWSRPERGFLRRYFVDGQDEPMVELTASSERALLWLQSLHETEFVATESRLENVFRDLDDLVRRASSDPDLRIAALLDDIAKLHLEIGRIRSTGAAETYTPVQINERFNSLLATARELISDFRQVEENFRQIAREIAERQSEPTITKGAIVGHMLDANDELRKSAQGQTFYAFWRLLLSDERQGALKDAIQRAYLIPDLDERLRANQLLTQLVANLLDAGEKVTKSNEHMSSNLRRVLETADLLERARVRELISEIEALALTVKHDPPEDADFFCWNELPDLFGSMSRDLWTPGDVLEDAGIPEEGDDTLSMSDLLRFRGLPQIQLRRLRSNIDNVLKDHDLATLEDVLTAYPPEHGMIEIVGYLIIAAEHPYSLIDGDTTARIRLPDGGRWRVPSVMFSRS